MNTSIEASAERHGFRWTMALGTLGLLLIAPLVPLAGIDIAAVEYLKGAFEPPPNLDALIGFGGRHFSPFCLSVSLLFWCRGTAYLVSGGKRYAERRAVNWIIFFVYLILSALQGLGAVLYLEGLHGDSLLGIVVPNPGLYFRAFGVLFIVTAQAIVWFATAWISRQGLFHGPLILFVVEILYRLSDWGYRSGLSGAQGELAFMDAAPLVGTVAAVTLLLVGGAVRFPKRLPVRLTSRIKVSTTTDAAALAVLAGSLSLPQESIASLLSGMLGIFGTIPQRPFLTVMMLSFPLSCVWILAWRKKAGAISARPGLLVLPVLFLLIIGGASAVGFQQGGGFDRMFGPLDEPWKAAVQP